MAQRTIQELYDHMKMLVPESPRTMAELDNYILETGHRYDELDMLWWIGTLAAGWIHGDMICPDCGREVWKTNPEGVAKVEEMVGGPGLWEIIVGMHGEDCQWIKTRGHRLTLL